MKKTVIIIIAALIITAGALAAFFLLSPSGKADIAAILSAGEKYLAEMNYEQAIIEFEKLIAIEPKNADNWLKLAEAYERSGQPDKAVQTLKKALENVDDDRIRMKLAELELLLNPQETTAAATTAAPAAAAETTVPETSPETTAPLPEFDGNRREIASMLKNYLFGGGELDTTYLAYIKSMRIVGEELIEIFVDDNYPKLFDWQVNWYDGNSSYYVQEAHNNKYTIVNAGEGSEENTYSFGDLSDLSFLKYFTNLENLAVTCNKITDISPVEGLTSLKRLALDCESITDISPLKDLTSLTHLSLGGNNISDISPLSGLTSLVRLDLHINNISDISPLEKLTSLEQLRLYSNNISDISPIRNMTKLNRLCPFVNDVRPKK